MRISQLSWQCVLICRSGLKSNGTDLSSIALHKDSDIKPASQPPTKPPRKNPPSGSSTKAPPLANHSNLSLWDTEFTDDWLSDLKLLNKPSEGLYQGVQLEEIIEELEGKLELDEPQDEYKVRFLLKASQVLYVYFICNLTLIQNRMKLKIYFLNFVSS